MSSICWPRLKNRDRRPSLSSCLALTSTTTCTSWTASVVRAPRTSPLRNRSTSISSRGSTPTPPSSSRSKPDRVCSSTIMLLQMQSARPHYKTSFTHTLGSPSSTTSLMTMPGVEILSPQATWKIHSRKRSTSWTTINTSPSKGSLQTSLLILTMSTVPTVLSSASQQDLSTVWTSPSITHHRFTTSSPATSRRGPQTSRTRASLRDLRSSLRLSSQETSTLSLTSSSAITSL